MTRTARMALTSTLALLIGAAGSLSARSIVQTDEPAQTTKVFSIRNTRDARGLAEKSEEHIRTKRWNEAILTLQKLIEFHRGDILPARMEDSVGRLSTYAFHPGAGAWATEQLLSMPPEAMQLYRDRYHKPAQQALSVAQQSGSRRSLIELSERWPLTQSAETAQWTLGDLEFELGSMLDAQRAWRRASDLAELAGRTLGSGAEKRLEMARQWQLSSERAETVTLQSNALTLPGPNQGRGPVPEDTAEPWVYRLPRNPFHNRRSGHNLYPIYFDDQVFVSTSWQTVALDAYTGELNWMSKEVPGWSQRNRNELVRGIDDVASMIAPAVSGSVVIAPIQVPFSRLRYATFQGIRITVPIPERRLFAFDRKTGTELWDHTPPLLWEGEEGNYAENMSLAGSPVAAGTRVIVPCYLMQGRIDFHVACYDVSTGERLWSTQLISGQRGLNMFGRHEREFSAPPVRIEGDRAIVLTQLGTVAALDIYTGQILWQSLYEQIPLPRNHQFRSTPRAKYWRNAPPVVADNTVLATPIDSEYLVAFDLEEGTVLWSYPYSLFNQSSRRSSSSDITTLLGADDDTLYFGGGRLAAFHSPAGLSKLSNQSRLTSIWSYPIDAVDGSDKAPRAILGRDELTYASRNGRVAVDKYTGTLRRPSSLPWEFEEGQIQLIGNLHLGDGMLFTATGEEVSGLFDWNILETRALQRIETDPSDIAAILTLSQIREQHGEMMYQNGDVRQALVRLQEARDFLEPNIGHESHAAQIATRMHSILRTSARARESLAETSVALNLLEEALVLAPNSDDIRDTLLQRESLLRGRNPALWLATLDELERRCTAKFMPMEGWELLLADPGPEPVIGFSRDDLDELENQLPVGLWVQLVAARSFGQAGDPVRELEKLHACLARYGSFVLTPEKNVSDVAGDWISAVLNKNGDSVYARFEERAQTMLNSAMLPTSEPVISVRDMELVGKHYPHSNAAKTASSILLQLAFDQEDADRVCRIVADSLTDNVLPTAEDATRLLMMAEVLGRAGNEDFRRGLFQALARDFPDLEIPEGERARTLSERLSDMPLTPTSSLLAKQIQFEADLVSQNVPQLNTFSVGTLPPDYGVDEPARPTRQVLLRETGNQVFLDIRSAAAPSQSTTLVGLRGMHDAQLFLTALTSRLVILSDGEQLRVIDAESGNNTWPTWRVAHGWTLVELSVGGGVLVAMLESDLGAYRAIAYDVLGGRELWNLNLPEELTWRAPLINGHRAVFLTESQTWQRDSEARVIDLYRGVELARLDLQSKLSGESCDAAYVQESILVLVGFHMASIPERNRVTGYDLESGLELWSNPLRDGREFDGLVQHEDSIYLIVSPGDDGAGGSILQIETRLGAIRPVMQLRLEDRILMPDAERSSNRGPIKLSAPLLFFYSAFSGGAKTPITAVHLPLGKQWVCSLRVPFDELYDVGMTFPASSESTIAIAYTKKTANYLAGDTFLTLIDREGGVKRGDYVLPRMMGNANDLELVGVGSSLFIMSDNSDGDFPMSLWETRR